MAALLDGLSPKELATVHRAIRILTDAMPAPADQTRNPA
jgi:hypothetical protein